MSGVEVAGLVLGAIPLVISGLEHYGEGIRTIKRLRNAEAEFRRLRIALETERAIFLNTLDLLLKDTVDEQTLEALLDNAEGGKHWSEPYTEECLRRKLRRTYTPYLENVKGIATSIEGLKQSLRLNDQGKGPFTSDKWSVAQALAKLQFGLKMKAYMAFLDDIKGYNSSLQQLTSQSASLEPVREARRRAPPNFEKARTYAAGLFDILRQALFSTCQSPHKASLHLHPHENLDAKSLDVARYDCTVFRLILHHEATMTAHPQLPWEIEETEIRLLDSGGIINATKASSTTIHAPGGSVRPQQSLAEIQDLCRSLSSLKATQCGNCLGYLLDPLSSCRHGLYWPQNRLVDQNTLEAMPLSALMVQQSSPLRDTEKRRLALSLTLGMLRLYDTPWLGSQWGRDDVVLYKTSKGLAIEHPFISMDLPSVGSRQLGVQRPQPYFQRCMLIENETVFALGVLLIELWIGQPLRDLSTAEDLKPDGSRHDLSDYLTAHRLINRVFQEAGPRYGDAVRRCIKCQFDTRETRLSDAAFRRAVYDGVVAGLETDLEAARSMP